MTGVMFANYFLARNRQLKLTTCTNEAPATFTGMEGVPLSSSSCATDGHLDFLTWLRRVCEMWNVQLGIERMVVPV